jgi:hypothetical protein
VRGFFQERSVTFGAGEIVRPISSTSALSSWITPQRQFQRSAGSGVFQNGLLTAWTSPSRAACSGRVRWSSTAS